jgi:small subunit ribosomal protein S17
MKKQSQEIIKRRFKGVVLTDKMQKTRVVAVEWRQMHPRYKKYYSVTRKFKAHDENNEYKTGDKVVIEETRPLSKEKRWIIKGLIEKFKT